MRNRIGISQVVFAALGIVIGVVIGGLGPREELRSLRAQQRTEARAGRSMGAEVARIFQGRGPAADLDAPPSQVEPEPVLNAPPDALPGDPSTAPADPELVEGPPAMALPDTESIEAMRDAMNLRANQAREALIQDADPDEDQLAEIDLAFADMNANLKELATGFVATYQASGAEPSRRDMMAFAADSLDVLIDSEDAITATLTPDQIAALSEESLDPLSYVDGSLVDVLSELDEIQTRP